MTRPPSRVRETEVRIGDLALTKRGGVRFDWRDPYHLAVTLSWRGFLLLMLGSVTGINLLFAGLYLLQPGAVLNLRPGSFADAFFFSMETLATVGYGVMAPATLYGHLVAGVEIIAGMGFTAIMTGLIFVRFSRPRSAAVYAGNAVVCRHNGVPTLMLRLGNPRDTPLLDVSVRLHVLLRETTQEGVMFRRPVDLPLIRAHNPVLALLWTLMHPITPDSPLFGYDPARLAEEGARLFLSVQMYDPTLGSETRDLRAFTAEQVRFATRFATSVEIDAQGRTVADLTQLDALEPDD